MKVIVAGDFCDRFRVKDAVSKKQYGLLFDDVKPIIDNADVSIVNFEMPIEFEEATRIRKAGPHLGGHINAADAVKYAGFNVCTLANNHILDLGEECCKKTVEFLKTAGIDVVGAGESLDSAERVLYITKKNKKLAIINCCEHEFSIAAAHMAGANPLNPVRQYYAINEARSNADYVLVIVHGGHEHYQLPSPRMQETYRFFVDCGADAVINHHQHCYSGYEIYNGKPICYGLGNFCFDISPIRVDDIWNYGYMVEIEFSVENTPVLEIHQYIQCGQKVGVHLLSNDQKIKSQIKELNSIIVDSKKIEERSIDYYQECEKEVKDVFEPLQIPIIPSLQHRSLFPSLLSVNWLVKMKDYIMCEAHRDKVNFFLESIIKRKQ